MHLEPEEVLPDYRRILRFYAQNAKVPGFRRGKVPLSLAERLFHEKAVARLLEEKLIPLLREEILKRAKPVRNPLLKDWSFDREKGVDLEAEFEEMPEYEVEGYEELEVEVEKIDTSPEKMVENTLEDLRRKNTVLEKKDEPAQVGDQVYIHLQRMDKNTKKRFPLEKYMVEVSDQEGLPSNLIGKKAGETFSYTETYPEDYPVKRLAGKEIVHEVKVLDVRRPVLPPLDDEFAKKYGYKNLQEMKKELLKRAKEQIKEMREGRIEEEIKKKLREKNPIPLPEVLVDEEFRKLATSTLMDITARGGRVSEEEWVAMSPQIKKEAERRVRDRFILLKIGEKQGFQVEKKDIREKIKEMASARGITQKRMRELLKKEGITDEDLKESLLIERALNYVKEHAIIKEKEKKTRKGKTKDSKGTKKGTKKGKKK